MRFEHQIKNYKIIKKNSERYLREQLQTELTETNICKIRDQIGFMVHAIIQIKVYKIRENPLRYVEGINLMTDKNLSRIIERKIRKKFYVPEIVPIYYAKIEENNYDILLVNDEPDILFLVKKILGLKGITCKLMGDVKEVLKELEHDHPIVVVLDEITPYTNGYHLCKQIKSDPKLNYIPVFVFGHEEMIKHHLDCKADGYIPYPFSFSDFDVIINLLLK